MKQKVKFSSYSIIVTAAVISLFIWGIFSLADSDDSKLTLFCIIAGATTIAGLYYCPKSVETDKYGIKLNRMISAPKVFPYGEIATVDTCYPSAGGLRLCGSGGFFGYWGYFSDIIIGTYFGYYGSRSNCILVKMKNGRQYILGCDDAVTLIGYIKSQMDK